MEDADQDKTQSNIIKAVSDILELADEETCKKLIRNYHSYIDDGGFTKE